MFRTISVFGVAFFAVVLSAGAAGVAQAATAPSLLAYWPFDGSSTTTQLATATRGRWAQT